MVDKIQPVSDPEPRAEFVIDDLEALKVMSHPLRLKILELMTHEPRTVKQIAHALDLTPNKLYYHVNLLEKHGFIQLVDVRMVSGILEKHYRVSAYDITVKEGLLKSSEPGGKEQIKSLIVSILDRTKEDILDAIKARAMSEDEFERSHMTLLTHRARMTKEKAVEFSRRLKELGEEFDQEGDKEEQGEGEVYALTTLLYPAFQGITSGEDEETNGE